MNIRLAKTIVKQYSKNEERNAHTENYHLLALHLGEKDLIHQTEHALKAQNPDRVGHPYVIPVETAERLNKFYYEVRDLANQEPAGVIDCTPTWEDIAPVLIQGLQSDHHGAVRGSSQQLIQCAKLADRFNKALPFIKEALESLENGADTARSGAFLDAEWIDEAEATVAYLSAALK